MRKLLLAVFVTFIVCISLFGYFHFEDRTVEIDDPINETAYSSNSDNLSNNS